MTKLQILKGMSALLNGFVVLGFIGMLVMHADAANARGGGSRSFYNGQGHYSGQAINNGNGTSSFYDGRGHFSGSAIQNSDGSTSFYNGSGHFIGSSSRR